MMKNLSEIEPSFKYDLKIDLTELRERIKDIQKTWKHFSVGS